MALRIDILTTFPEMFTAVPPAALGLSIPARARAAGLVEWHATNIRDHANNKHDKTDDRPFGGGPGMVMSCQPVWDAVQATEAMDPRPATRVLLSPQGVPLKQSLVRELAKKPRLLLIAGHYEGIDERVIERLAPLEISIGDYVLSGGELAAMVLIDAVVRLIPGALGDDESVVAESFSTAAEHPLEETTQAGEQPAPKSRAAKALAASVPPDTRLLDCPHYTRPRVWEGMEVPDVLLSGDHARVARWRLEQRIARTRARRPDLFQQHAREP
ncbi:MAG: tRNA (guanosine(37)-N1)-methyltransferase TrmD [Planctomycetota bacterium]|nr:tRNA (guanosine(37)-N1)-methyltransferase TrmD [Planctomycetota bacterium]